MDEAVSSAEGSPLDVLAARGVPFTLHEHPDIRVASDIREHTTMPIERSVKTLAFSVENDRLVLAAIPGLARISFGRFASALGVARSKLRPAGGEMLSEIGMRAGGVSPICARPDVTVVIDSAVPPMGQVFCGSGRSDRSVELDSGSLVHLSTSPVVADIADMPL